MKGGDEAIKEAQSLTEIYKNMSVDMFNQYDKNHDQIIDRSELKPWHEEL